MDCLFCDVAASESSVAARPRAANRTPAYLPGSGASRATIISGMSSTRLAADHPVVRLERIAILAQAGVEIRGRADCSLVRHARHLHDPLPRRAVSGIGLAHRPQRFAKSSFRIEHPTADLLGQRIPTDPMRAAHGRSTGNVHGEIAHQEQMIVGPVIRRLDQRFGTFVDPVADQPVELFERLGPGRIVGQFASAAGQPLAVLLDVGHQVAARLRRSARVVGDGRRPFFDGQRRPQKANRVDGDLDFRLRVRLKDRGEILFDGLPALHPRPFVVDHLAVGGEQRGNSPRRRHRCRPWSAGPPRRAPPARRHLAWRAAARLGGRRRGGLGGRSPRFGFGQQQPSHAQQCPDKKQEDRSHGESPYFPKQPASAGPIHFLGGTASTAKRLSPPRRPHKPRANPARLSPAMHAAPDDPILNPWPPDRNPPPQQIRCRSFAGDLLRLDHFGSPSGPTPRSQHGRSNQTVVRHARLASPSAASRSNTS